MLFILQRTWKPFQAVGLKTSRPGPTPPPPFVVAILGPEDPNRPYPIICTPLLDEKHAYPFYMEVSLSPDYLLFDR